jgi:NitT/TauT family transport system ATP-binding protein
MRSTSATADPRLGDDAVRGRAVLASGVAKVFATHDEPVVALAGIDLAIAPGEFVSILGPSGCGKSTLLSIIGGLDAPSAGEVAIDGRPVTGPELEAGVMFQRDLLLDWRTCERNVLLQFEMRGESARPHQQRARELLDMAGVGPFARRYPRELSGGMRQRVALCRALVHDPPLLLMDEPFGALDALTRENLNLELARLTAESGATVLFVTHGIDEAVFLADRVIVMSARPGRILADVRIELERPRTLEVRGDARFAAYAAELRRLLTSTGALEEAHHV